MLIQSPKNLCYGIIKNMGILCIFLYFILYLSHMENNFVTIKDFPNYEINRLGIIKNKKTNKPVKVFVNNQYYRVNLRNNGKVKLIYLHRILASAFIPNPNNLPEINHIDGDKLNYSLDNLEWCDSQQNKQHARENGLQISKRSKESKLSKKVGQYDLTNKLIKIWDCVMDIERTLGIKSGAISNCCLGKSKTSAKYIWRYQ